MQRLACVDVAEAGDHPLIEQRRLERRALAGAGARERGAVERGIERLGTHRAERAMARQLARRHEIHHPEAARVVEDHRGARRHVKDHVVVRVGRLGGRAALALDAKPAGHAEVHQQRLVRRQLGDEILAAPTQRPDRPAGQARREIARKRTPEVPAPQLDALEARAFHGGRDLAADLFDFG